MLGYDDLKEIRTKNTKLYHIDVDSRAQSIRLTFGVELAGTAFSTLRDNGFLIAGILLLLILVSGTIYMMILVRNTLRRLSNRDVRTYDVPMVPKHKQQDITQE